MSAGSRPFVTIAMPALNEDRYLARAILSLGRISPDIDYEIIVLDGGSGDWTREIVDVFGKADDRIRLVRNEARLQSAAVNLAASIADPRSEYLLRADCHADYPDGFVASCLDAMRVSGADSVVVRMETVGATCFQKAVATAQNSRLGNGGAAHRNAGVSAFVDHGHHALFRLSAFREVGGYDGAFSHNEDAELDVRLKAAGRTIWLNATAPITYYPRSTISSLARQYFAFGKGRARTMRKHGTAPKLRQMLPVAAVAASLLGLLLSPLHPAFLLVPLAYAAAAVLAGLALAVVRRSLCSAASGIAALVMHGAWAFGFASTFLARRPGGARPGDAEQPLGPVAASPPPAVRRAAANA